jgi:RNA polymerase sigma-70 factor (ECF subfamily)
MASSKRLEGSAEAGDRARNSDDRASDRARSTEQHLARARRGDPAGFGVLYERLAPAIYAWASLRIHPTLKGRLDPEDVVQEVWWRAMDSFASFDPAKGSFRAWVFSIATHTLLNSFRGLRVRGEMRDEHRRIRMLALPPEIVDQATSVSQKAARHEEARALITLVEQLTHEDRSLFIHCALEGQSPRKIAALLGLGADAAVKRWQRLRARLRSSLADVGVVVPEE